jgi:uncharacterized protein DUF6778
MATLPYLLKNPIILAHYAHKITFETACFAPRINIILSKTIGEITIYCGIGAKMKRSALKSKLIKYIAGMALALTVTACATPQNVTSNNIITATPENYQIDKPAYLVQQLTVTVPDELTVSEANVFLPLADIVWREDPLGDRKQQVQDILIDAIVKGVSKVADGQPVIMEVRLSKFHALTEKTRYTVGGRHNIKFDYILRDAQTGAPVTDVKHIDASLKAYGGSNAVAAMARGETQKVRITQRIEELMYMEMSDKTES